MAGAQDIQLSRIRDFRNMIVQAQNLKLDVRVGGELFTYQNLNPIVVILDGYLNQTAELRFFTNKD